MPIPSLVDPAGLGEDLLPTGVHPATLSEVEDAFVAPFGLSVTRSRIASGWKTFRTVVGSLVTIQHEYIDGSFVSNRLNPDDIDLSLWIRAVDMDALSPDDSAALAWTMRKCLDVYKCDAYIVPVCRAEHGLYAEHLRMKATTELYWSTYKDLGDRVRPEVRKGYIEVVP
jgi:uncharacterized protein DUF6932